MTAPHPELLGRFVAAFRRGIQEEMAAMQGQADSFEIALADGAGMGERDARHLVRYRFQSGNAADRLSVGTTGTLRIGVSEQAITIEDLEATHVTVSAEHRVDPKASPAALVVAPWFLYERLVSALEELDVARHAIGGALALFGKAAPARAASALVCDHAALNEGQRAAVQLCSDSSLAFIWGPPGTGKTTTLTHIVEELIAQHKTILLVSTTNAAIDQVLAKLAARPAFSGTIGDGSVVRLGRSDAETYGTELAAIALRLHRAHAEAIDRLRARVVEAERLVRQGEALVARLEEASQAQQSLFADLRVRLAASALAGLLPLPVAQRCVTLREHDQLAIVRARVARFTRLAALCKASIVKRRRALHDDQAGIVGNARLVLSTLANSYLSPVMTDARFDVVIAEEASMAILPALFYAAALARDKVIVVGDPRQLPAILHSSRPAVHQVMGRSVFEVGVTDPLTSDIVAMLDVQYRMHPAIGSLVGRLFYDGRLRTRGDTAQHDAIAAGEPFGGAAVVVVDTAARTTCRRAPDGSSRVNAETAELSAQLATAAAHGGTRSVAVITPYQAQARAIRALLADRAAASIECSTIHRFQGHESDIVIFDTVDAAPMAPGMLLSGDGPASVARNLLNVSISRARGKLIIVADVRYFEDRLPRGIITELLRHAMAVGTRNDGSVTETTGVESR
jgi:hypothetical protein